MPNENENQSNEPSLGQLLSTLIERSGISQTTLAIRARTSQPVISAICNGRRRCGLKVAIKLANALELCGENRQRFLSFARRPHWKGFDNELYGFEAMLYDFVSRSIRQSGVIAEDIASITNISNQEDPNQRVIFVMKNGNVRSLNVSVTSLCQRQ